MKAQDIMQRDLITATAETAMDDAVRMMVANRISGLPVVDAAGAVVGIISEGDLLRRTELGTGAVAPGWIGWLAGQGRAAREYVRENARRVGEVMTVPVVTVTPQTELAEVVALMESRRINRVPVVQEGRLVGMLTRADLLRALAGLLPKADTRPVADAELRRRLLGSLRAQKWVPRVSFDVKVVDGVAELLGVITDERARAAARVLVENTPGVRAVVDHLIWIDPMSGMPIDRQPRGAADLQQRRR
ncbi:MAG: CBS domain-containing protein [Gammaproteobacteria bacterium]|nr:CBS domain-containing protein [Gammaproteobacteria bacterium]